MRKPLLLTALLALAGCETIDSADVATSGIHAHMTVTADGTGRTRVRTELRTGGAGSNTYLELAPGDRLYAFADTTEAAMRERTDPLSRIWYEAAFDTDRDGLTFRVEFARADHDDADESLVRLPPPFELTGPDSGTAYHFEEDPLPITWDGPSDDALDLEVRGLCIRPFTRTLPSDTGRHLLPPGTLTPRPEWSGDACTLELTLTRRREGALDPGFHSGRIVGQQVRTQKVVVAR